MHRHTHKNNTLLYQDIYKHIKVKVWVEEMEQSCG